MKTFTRGVLLASFGILGLSLISCGSPHCRKVDDKRLKQMVDWKLNDMLDELKATPEQREQAEDVKGLLLNEFIAKRPAQQAARQEFITELLKEKPDPEKLHALIDRHVDSLRAFAHKALDAIIDSQFALTAEQRDRLGKKAQECMDQQ
jgi:periplasmic protein CpxP/Spy